MFLSKLINPKFLLIIICIFFLVTRLYRISEIPPSVYWDEASIGYNAFSIAQTGADEWRQFLPVHFRAFGEFKLPVYIYTTAIFVKIFGLNEFSIRLPAVFYSLGVIITTYYLAKRLTDSSNIGLLSSFFISVSPWFFIFSRTGYEVTAGLLFYLLGIYLYLRFSKNRWSFLILTSSFILSAYSYNSFRIISPLTILIFFVINIKLLIRQKIIVSVSIILLVSAALPIYRLFIFDAGIARLKAVSSSPQSIISNYFSHFNPTFLFVSGDNNLRSQQAGFGQLYFPELILLPLGLLYFSRKSKYSILLIFLILIGPIPAAITKESPHALRAIVLAPFLHIISASGVVQLSRFFKGKYKIYLGVMIIWLAFFANYLTNFINLYSTQSSKDWQYGYKRIYTDFEDQFGKYNRIIISDEYAQPYIFALFYLNYNPEKFQKGVIRNNVSEWGFSTVSKFDKFEFGKVDNLLGKDDLSNSLIFASKEDEIPGLTPLTSIKFLDDTIAFWVYAL